MEKIGFDSRKKSILETVTDVVLGFVIFLPVNYFVLPLFVDQIADYSIIGMLTISAIFTSISLVRKYVIRRWFENQRKISVPKVYEHYCNESILVMEFIEGEALLKKRNLRKNKQY